MAQERGGGGIAVDEALEVEGEDFEANATEAEKEKLQLDFVLEKSAVATEGAGVAEVG